MRENNNISLRSLLDSDTFISPETALNILSELTDYLQEKYKHGAHFPILRPDDITVNEWGGNPEVYCSTDIPEQSGYRSPEERHGGKVDERALIWSLGGIFFELLTGYRFDAYTKTNKKLPDLKGTHPNLSEEIVLTLYRMTEPDPDLRIKDLNTLRLELRRLEALLNDKTLSLDRNSTPIPGTHPRQNLSPDERIFNISRFVGRDRELSELSRLITDENNRLITILGLGGMGKSRLAFELLQKISGHFRDGTFFIPLNATRSPAFIVFAIANAIGFIFGGKQETATQLRHYLSKKEILLVLDDFDELVEGADIIVDLLGAAPDLRILVTSRERLNIRSERVYELRGLPFPRSDSMTPPLEMGSILLFTQHARRIHPAFAVESEIEGIMRLCRLLEGIPLGIEMAAQWTRVLSCREIADEIERDIDFLETLERDVPERHRGMRATFDRSWELLTEREQSCLKNLAIFQGGFSRDAAEYVAHVDLQLLSAFMNKSLISRNAFGRYRFHELIRQYCERKLKESHHFSEVITRFLQYYETLLHRRAHHVWELEHAPILDEMELEFSNIQIVWDFALERMNIAVLLKIYSPLYAFFEIKGWIRESHQFWKNAVQRLDSMDEERAEASHLQLYGCVLSRLAYTYLVRGQFAKARSTFMHAYDTLKSVDDFEEIILVLAGLGEVASREGDYETARNRLLEGIDLCKSIDDQTYEASLLDSLGNVSMYQGDYDNAEMYHAESKVIWMEIGYQRGIAKSLNNIGNVHYCRGSMDKALESYEEAIAYNKKASSKRGLRTALSNKGNVFTHKGYYKEAQSIYEECLALAEELGDLHGIAHTKYQLSITAYSLGDFESSMRLGKESLLIHEESGERRGEALVLESLGIASIRMNNLTMAEEYLDAAILIFRELNARWGLASSLSKLGKVYLAVDKIADAARTIREGLDIAISIGSDNLVQEALTYSALTMEQMGDIRTACYTIMCVVRSQDTAPQKSTQAQKEIHRLSEMLDENVRAELESSVPEVTLIECAKETLSYFYVHRKD